jgi:hypothetical protein
LIKCFQPKDEAWNDYNEADFRRDFVDIDDLALYEMDPRSEIASPSWTERLEADSMGATSAAEAVVRMQLPEEDSKTIDVQVTEGGTLLLVYSHRYKLRWFLPKAVVDGSQKATWDGETCELTIIVRPKRKQIGNIASH